MKKSNSTPFRNATIAALIVTIFISGRASLRASSRDLMGTAVLAPQGHNQAKQDSHTSNPPAWTRPIAPFHIAGNVYYVGSEGLAAYLITTPKGAILLDGMMEENVPAIEANIRALGIKLSDVKILLNSHAHFDHADGLAHLKRDAGATMMAMKGDVWALENGKHFGDQSYVGTFLPVKVDRVLTDGAKVTLGGVTMTALATPGHTAGCTTWVLPIRIKTGVKTVVFPCSMTVAGSKLVGNRQYPGIVGDFRRTFDRMAKLKADIVLPAHPELAQVTTRKGNEFLQPRLLATIVAKSQASFEEELSRQRVSARAADAILVAHRLASMPAELVSRRR